ncbi:hypothetical protein MRX96_041061 [Rhipicephalus microplus]
MATSMVRRNNFGGNPTGPGSDALRNGWAPLFIVLLAAYVKSWTALSHDGRPDLVRTRVLVMDNTTLSLERGKTRMLSAATVLCRCVYIPRLFAYNSDMLVAKEPRTAPGRIQTDRTDRRDLSSSWQYKFKNG